MTDHAPPCRLCGSSETALALHLPRAPRSVSRLLTTDEVSRDRPVPVSVYECRACGFVYLNQFLQDDFYDDYVMTVSHSPLMDGFQRNQARTLVERFGLVGKRVVEIGCGDGNYMVHLQGCGAEVTGTEPSASFRRLALARGFAVHDGYVTRDTPAPGGPYDGFATREVLEHVPDIHSFLAGVRRSLAPGGGGLVEVPRLEQALEGGRFYDFFPDHVNYFTARTLRLALEWNGFEVVSQSAGMNGEFHEAWVRVAGSPDLGPVRASLKALTDDLRRYVGRFAARGERVAVWGSGGKGLATLAAADVAGLAYVVDSDPHKHGRFTPVSGLPIHPPERLRTDPVAAVVVTAMAYRDEVLRQLREVVGFSGPVALLGARLEELPAVGGGT